MYATFRLKPLFSAKIMVAGTNISIIQTVYAGISVVFTGPSSAAIAVTVRDSTYLLEFLRHEFDSESPEALEQSIMEAITSGMRRYETKYMEKFLGIAFPKKLTDKCPRLCSKIWKDIDVVPFVVHDTGERTWGDLRQDNMENFNLDEQSESMARTCIRFVSLACHCVKRINILCYRY